MAILFVIISILGLLSALGTVLARNLVHAALFLVGFFFAIACQFVLLEAEFLAVIQVFIYIGAVAILLMFAIMLTRNVQGDETTTVPWLTRIVGAVIGVGVLVVLVVGIAQERGVNGKPPWRLTATRPAVSAHDPTRREALHNMSRDVGREMMTTYVVAFEVAGLLLTAALVGAIALAQLEGSEEEPRTGAIPTLRPDTTEGPGSGNGQGPPLATKPEALTTPT